MPISQERLKERSSQFWDAQGDERDPIGKIVMGLPDADLKDALKVMAEDGAKLAHTWMSRNIPPEKAGSQLVKIWVKMLSFGKKEVTWGLQFLLDGLWEVMVDWREENPKKDYPRSLKTETAVMLLKAADPLVVEDSYHQADYNKMLLSLAINNYPFVTDK